MSILSPDTMQFQSLVKKLSDGALSQALQMHADPSDPKGFWLAQEAMGRAAARKDAQSGNANQPTVAQQLAQQLNPQPPMPPQGMPPMPPQGMPPMPPQGVPGMGAMPPQGMPPQMQAGGHVHDYGIAGLPYEPHYEHGGIVSFAEGGDEGMDEGLYEGQSFEGYNPDDVSQMLAENTRYDDPNNFPGGPHSPLAELHRLGYFLPDRAKNPEEPSPTQKGTIDYESLKDTPTGAGPTGLEKYIPNLPNFSDRTTFGLPERRPGDNPPLLEKLRGYGGDSSAPGKPFEAAPTPRRASPTDLYNPSIPTIAAEEPAAPMPPNIREVTPTGLASGADRFLMRGAGLPAAASAASGGKSYDISGTAKPVERTPQDDIKDAEQLKRLNELYGYNPDLKQKLIEENSAALAGLSKKRGKAALSDLAAAMVAFGQGTAKQGLMSFGQTLNERFRQSDKEIDAEEAAYKKRDSELREGMNDLRKNNVEKGMAKIEKANADFTAWKANQEKGETERNKTAFEKEREAQEKALDREADLRKAYAEIASNEYRTRYASNATAGDKTDPVLATMLKIIENQGVSPNTLMQEAGKIDASIDDSVVEAEVDRRTGKTHDWRNVKPNSDAAKLKSDIRKEMVSSILSNRAAEAGQLSAKGPAAGLRALMSGQPTSGTRGPDFYSVLPR
jgi:hypothetical protein